PSYKNLQEIRELFPFLLEGPKVSLESDALRSSLVSSNLDQVDATSGQNFEKHRNSMCYISRRFFDLGLLVRSGTSRYNYSMAGIMLPGFDSELGEEQIGSMSEPAIFGFDNRFTQHEISSTSGESQGHQKG